MCFLLRTSLSRFLGLQEREGRFLSDDRRAEIYACGMAVCKRYIDLAKHALRQGVCHSIFISCRVFSDQGFKCVKPDLMQEWP